MFAPASPSASAICRPRPRDPPVTSAVRPDRSKSFWTGVLMAAFFPMMVRVEGWSALAADGARANDDEDDAGEGEHAAERDRRSAEAGRAGAQGDAHDEHHES